jgi:hypothetical protein
VVHSPELECGDKDCHAPVIFRKGAGEGGVIYTHGQSFQRSKHFATLPKRQHRDGCTNKDLQDDPEGQGAGFRAAIADPAMKLVINLNGETGSGLKVRFGKAAQVEQSSTEFGQFMRDNKKAYASISLQTLPELIAQIRQIREAGGQAALARTYICHLLSVRPLREFLVGHKPEAIKALYRRMFDGDDVLAVQPDCIIGFPRLFHFVPTEATRKAEQPNRLFGNSITVTTRANDACRMVLLSGLETGSDRIKEAFNAAKEMLVLACPVIHPVDARQESLLYKRGEKADGHKGATKPVDGGVWFLYMDWIVAAESQLNIVPETKRQLKDVPAEPIATAAQQKLAI